MAFLKRLKKNQPAVANAGTDNDDDQRYKPLEMGLVRRIAAECWPYRKRYLLGTIVGTIMIVLEMQSPNIMRTIIDFATAYHAQSAGEVDKLNDLGAGSFIFRILDTLTGWMNFGPALQSQSAAIAAIVVMVLFWACVLGAALLLQRLVLLIFIEAGERVQFSLREKIFAQLQRLSMSYYDKTKLGRIISRCTSDIGSLREVNVWGVHQITANLLMMIVASFMLWYTDWRLFLSVAWLGPVLMFTNHFFRKKAGDTWQVVREGFTRVSTNLAENITGVRVVTAFNRQAPNLDAFNALQDVNTANNMTAARVNGIYQPTLMLIGFVGRIIILSFGTYLVISSEPGQGTRSVGSVVAAYLYWEWFMAPIINFGNFYNQLMMAMAGAERVFALLDMEPEVADTDDAKPIPRITGHVQFENVTFGYNPERPVLFDVNFEAKPGQVIALVGATGSGKSSIISLIARFYQPQQGRVLVDGHDIRYVTGESLHRQMGLVLQVNYLFSGTVMENIRYARPDATEEEVLDAMRALGSYDAIMSLPDGLNSQVGERGGSMSLGQRQLICFTRAFVSDSRIFMLDEATSAIDTGTEQLLQQSLERLLEGRTTFIVAHRLSTIMRADQILVLDHGKIVERGTHGELLKVGGRYAHLYEQFVKHT